MSPPDGGEKTCPYVKQRQAARRNHGICIYTTYWKALFHMSADEMPQVFLAMKVMTFPIINSGIIRVMGFQLLYWMSLRM